MEYITSPLQAVHNKSSFTCGQTSLDNYIMRQASQDLKRHISVVFVLTDSSNNIKGYYTLSSDNILRDIIPPEVKKKMPYYQDLPVILLGRLAVDKKYQGNKLGEMLLIDALKRSYNTSRNTIGAIAIVTDPVDNKASAFYKKYGFISLPDSRRMFLSMQTIKQLF